MGGQEPLTPQLATALRLCPELEDTKRYEQT